MSRHLTFFVVLQMFQQQVAPTQSEVDHCNDVANQFTDVVLSDRNVNRLDDLNRRLVVTVVETVVKTCALSACVPQSLVSVLKLLLKLLYFIDLCTTVITVIVNPVCISLVLLPVSVFFFYLMFYDPHPYKLTPLNFQGKNLSKIF